MMGMKGSGIEGRHDRPDPSSETQTPLTASAKRVEALSPADDDFTYTHLPSQAGKPTVSERRGSARQRTRLRSGKLVRRDGQFLCECLVNNRSPSGCRLKLATAIPDLQSPLFFYDDQSELLYHARLIWRRDREIGLRLSSCVANQLHISIIGAMRRKFYTLRR